MALLKNSSSDHGTCSSHLHCLLLSPPVSPCTCCSTTLTTLLPAGKWTPSTVVGPLRFPTWEVHRSAFCLVSKVGKVGGFLSGTASGLICRRDCFPTVARSAAATWLCLDFCLRLAGGCCALMLVSAAMALATSLHSSFGYSHSSSVANFHPALPQFRPQALCSHFWCVHCFRRLSSSLELVRKEVFLSRPPPTCTQRSRFLPLLGCQ